jgi:pimeloyl-ACP methyl ester carboxylesterase
LTTLRQHFKINEEVGAHRSSEVFGMLRVLVRAVLSCLPALALFWIAPLARAQEKKAGEEIQFDTFDRVELHGTFYASGKTKAPCVILLHKVGGNRQEKGLDELAQALSKEYAVLSFDFRGHGESTKVDPTFWANPNNSALIKGAAKRPAKVNHKDFSPNYYPMLANDVVAAKRYLDKQNDANECNSSNVIVVGEQDGGAVGALWIATEWSRPKIVRSPNPLLRPIRDPTKVEGEDVACAVWLSIPRALGTANVGNWLRGKVRDKVPMAFFYGEKDQKGATAAQGLFNEMKPGKEKLEFTTTRAVKGTSLVGADLIGQKSLKTEDEIVNYLEKVLQKRGNKAWVMHGVDSPLLPIPLSQFGLR